MGKVIQDVDVRERVDGFLDYLFQQWANVPEQAADWNEWDEDSKVDFILDWPICEDRLQQLRRYADEGMLMPEQTAQYRKLLRLVSRNRPVLERMLQT